ncbi:MAG: hypothetical protein GY862_39670 [Gammaproteobacteria bacterium]|nr:hypothetical protein [Gammaproteobacteria bacterium]
MNSREISYTKTQRFLAVLLACLLISACGFHLRGAVDLPESLASVYIQADKKGFLAGTVQRALRERGVNIAETIEKAGIVVALRDEKTERRVLSVSAVSGKQEEVELNQHVDLEVFKPDGTVLLKKRRLSLVRDFTYDETAVLAKDTEERILREELRRDLAIQILYSLEALANNKDL